MSRINTVSRLVSVIVKIPQPIRISLTNHIRQQSIRPLRKHTNPVRRLLHSGHARKPSQLLHQRSHLLLAVQVQFIHLLRPHRTLQRSRSILHQNLPMVDDGHAIAQLIGLFHVVRRQHHRNPLLAQPAHRLPHRNAALRIEPRAWLIQKQHLRMVRNRPRNLHPLRQPSRQLRRISPSPLRQMKLRQQLLRPPPRLSPRKPEVQTMKIDILEDRASPIQRVVLRHHANASPRSRGHLHHIDPRNPHSSRRRQSPRRADADRRRLPRAIRPQQAKQLPLANAQVNPVDSNDPLLAFIDLPKTFNLNNHSRTSLRRSLDYKQSQTHSFPGRNADHDLPKVRARLHIRKRLTSLIESKHSIHHRPQPRSIYSRIHLLKHRP